MLKDYRAKPVTMQLLWRGITVSLRRFSIDLMFGCASLPGTDPAALALPLSYLHHFHGMSADLRVMARPELYVSMNLMPKESIDTKEALRTLPPLIKGYVRAGASVGDGAVIDRQFGTTDVLIILPVEVIRSRYFDHFGAPDELASPLAPEFAPLN